MLTGFHTIDGNVYYFAEKESDEWRYGQMVTGTIEVYGGVYTFDGAGHMTGIYGGLE
jgi:glucan-binding YG repeat protein